MREWDLGSSVWTNIESEGPSFLWNPESWSSRGKKEGSLKSQRRRKVGKKSTWEKQPRQMTGNLSDVFLPKHIPSSLCQKKKQLVHLYLLKTCSITSSLPPSHLAPRSSWDWVKCARLLWEAKMKKTYRPEHGAGAWTYIFMDLTWHHSSSKHCCLWLVFVISFNSFKSFFCSFLAFFAVTSRVKNHNDLMLWKCCCRF